VFVPEQRHPVEVAAADEAHLVAWLSKRLDAPVTVPHLGDAGWSLLGGRLLPADAGPVAQFMYEDARGRRLTLAVTRPLRDETAQRASDPEAAFRIAHEGDETVFYWIDRRFAYALTGRLTQPEMTAIADRVYRQLDREFRSDVAVRGRVRLPWTSRTFARPTAARRSTRATSTSTRSCNSGAGSTKHSTRRWSNPPR
jgi:hypothetical protein